MDSVNFTKVTLAHCKTKHSSKTEYIVEVKAPHHTSL